MVFACSGLSTEVRALPFALSTLEWSRMGLATALRMRSFAIVHGVAVPVELLTHSGGSARLEIKRLRGFAAERLYICSSLAVGLQTAPEVADACGTGYTPSLALQKPQGLPANRTNRLQTVLQTVRAL